MTLGARRKLLPKLFGLAERAWAQEPDWAPRHRLAHNLRVAAFERVAVRAPGGPQ